MNQALKSTLIYTAVLLAPVAAAQPSGPDVGGLVSQVCNVSETNIIGGVTVGEALERLGVDPQDAFFFCNYSGLVQRAERMGNSFVNGMGSFAEGIGAQLLTGTLDLLGAQIGAQAWAEDLNEQLAGANEQLNEAMALIEEGDERGLAAYRQALQEAFDQARTSAAESLNDDLLDPTRHPEGSPERREAEFLASNPEAAARVAAQNEALLNIAQQRAEADAALVAVEAAASSFLGDTSFSDVVANVVTPADPTDPTATPGTAARLEQGASRATSTREAINELSRGWADYMRQDAVLSANVVEGLRASVQQQALTNWQLKAAADRELQKEYDKIAAEQAQLRIELETSKDEIDAIFNSLSDMVSQLENSFHSENLPEFCEMVGGC